MKVLNAEGEKIGRLHDISMRLIDDIFPKADNLVIARGMFQTEYALVSIEHVRRQGRMFILKEAAPPVTFQKEKMRLDFSLCRQILDQQVVDMDDHKVVRVNDVHLLQVDRSLYLAHVDVSLKGLIRRLEWSGLVNGILKVFAPKCEYLQKEELVSWRNTHVLNAGRVKNLLRADVTRLKLAKIPSVDLADIMEDLDVFEKLSLFKTFTLDLQRKVFAEMATQDKLELIDQLPDGEAGNLLENIPADEAADLLQQISKEERMRIFKYMHSRTSKMLRQLLDFEQDSAGGLMTMEYLSLGKDAKVQDALALLKKSVEFAGNIFNIYILDEKKHLLGVTGIRRFINEDPEKPLLETCPPDKIFVRTDDGMEEIALLLEKYKLMSIPVLDESDVLQGVITSDDVMEELIVLAWKKYKDQI